MFQLPDRKFRDFKAALADGVILTRVVPDNICAAGFFTVDTNGGDIEICPNAVSDEGRAALLGTLLDAKAQDATWYTGIYTGVITPDNTFSMTEIIAGTEWTAYTRVEDAGAFRPLYDPDALTYANPGASTSITNSGTKSGFTSTGAATLRGAFISADQTRLGDTVPLVAAANFGTARTVGDTDVVSIQYTLTLT